MRPFNVISGDQLATMLLISSTELSMLVAAGVIPQPDAGACTTQYAWTWAWNTATVATAVASLTQASVQATLVRCRGPLPDGTYAVKPYMATPNSSWAI
jgi:hypothetical protein